MKKLQLMYDVLQTLVCQEKVAGVLQAEAVQDGNKVFALTNEFSRSFTGGPSKTRLTLEFDSAASNGHETDCRSCGHGCGDTGKAADWFERHHEYHKAGHGPQGRPYGPIGGWPGHGHHGGCWRGKLARLTALLGILSAAAVEETAGGAVISLQLSDLPEKLRNKLLQKMNHCGVRQRRGGIYLNELANAQELQAQLTIQVNGAREVTAASLTAAGITGGKETVKLAASFVRQQE